MWQLKRGYSQPRECPLFSYMADEIAQSSPGGGMGFREGQVTNATKRGECHKWMMFMKELVVELLNSSRSS